MAKKEKKRLAPAPLLAPENPAEKILSGGVRGEVAGCPTGLAPAVEQGTLPPPDDGEEYHGKLEVEELEARQGANDLTA